MLALWIGGSMIPLQSVENHGMIRWVQCLNPKVIVYLICLMYLCLPQWIIKSKCWSCCQCWYDSSNTLSFVRPLCQAGRQSQGWLLVKSASRWLGNWSQKPQSPESGVLIKAIIWFKMFWRNLRVTLLLMKFRAFVDWFWFIEWWNNTMNDFDEIMKYTWRNSWPKLFSWSFFTFSCLSIVSVMCRRKSED